jgi:hypothetical protein
MLRIRRRILSAVWNKQDPTRVESIGQFPVARFLHVDLDSSAVIDEGKSQRTDPWYELVKLTDEERLVEPIDLPQYHESDDSLARFPLIESWMPLRPKKLRSLGIDPSKGAGQIRAVARLYLFDKYAKLRGRIKGALNFLSSNAGNERKENYQRLGLQVRLGPAHDRQAELKLLGQLQREADLRRAPARRAGRPRASAWPSAPHRRR